MIKTIVASVSFLLAVVSGATGQSFVNFETPHVHPLAMTPDGTKLLAVNTPDNRLEVFTLTADGPLHAGSIAVGLEPVTVRARTNTEVWVVNHLSDSVSIIDLPSMRVTNTITVGDEPTDVVFAGTRQKAFVCLSQLNQVKVYDPITLMQTGAPIAIQGEDPRALATDGTNVYAAIFESGTDTTVLDFNVVSSAVNPYPGDPNPPPNSGTSFDPPIGAGLPTPPRVSLIVKRNGSQWVDDNNGNWTTAVTWGTHGNDVSVINANSLAVSYVKSLMNINMAMAVKPGGQITVIGTDAINHVRFEPNVNGVFVRVKGASFSAGGAATVVDLNPHLTYATSNIPFAQRVESIGDPRGIVWRSDGNRAYITGMGSNNVIAVDGTMARVGRVQIGQGPTGIVLDETRELIYVLNKFDGSISVIDEQSLSVVNTVPMFDPTPPIIKQGRPFLYDTHLTSGLGQASCASCHIDGRTDHLAWDLGDPSGTVKLFNQTCQSPLGGACEDWHPMKGPMVTQTLVGLAGTGPLHWRGDRANLGEFNPAFVGLLGADALITPLQMNQFEQFLNTVRFPPQPNRNFDNSLPTIFPNGGNPAIGQQRFTNQPIDGGVLTCVFCHALPTGTNGTITPAQALQDTQSVKIPQLRNMYEKTGLLKTSQNNDRGFGFIKDGTVDTLFEFLKFSGFNFTVNPQPPATADQQRRDIEAFMLSFPTGTHAAIGVQTTVLNGGSVPAPQATLINNMIIQANANTVGLVVKGVQGGIERGYSYIGSNNFQSDRAAQTISAATLLASATSGSELTYTVVPTGSQTRIGIDRDLDGYFDRDELDACSDLANPLITPVNMCKADVSPMNGDGTVGVPDLLAVINAWGNIGTPGFVHGDVAPDCGDGTVGVPDLLAVINDWGPCP